MSNTTNTEFITGKLVTFLSNSGTVTEGVVLLVFTDAIASGTSDYVPLTYLSISDNNGTVHTVQPRNLRTIIKPQPQKP